MGRSWGSEAWRAPFPFPLFRERFGNLLQRSNLPYMGMSSGVDDGASRRREWYLKRKHSRRDHKYSHNQSHWTCDSSFRSVYLPSRINLLVVHISNLHCLASWQITYYHSRLAKPPPHSLGLGSQSTPMENVILWWKAEIRGWTSFSFQKSIPRRFNSGKNLAARDEFGDSNQQFWHSNFPKDLDPSEDRRLVPPRVKLIAKAFFLCEHLPQLRCTSMGPHYSR